MCKEFPCVYPNNLLDLIVADGAEEKPIEVFRICRNGTVNRDSFVSSIQDPYRKIKDKEFVNRDSILWHINSDVDIGMYSTSCFESLKDAIRVFGMMVQSTPKQIVAKGITDPSCGLSMRTKDSKSHRRFSGTHVDWWLYKDAKPELFFREFSLEREMNK